jgi:hypothetical protein
MLNIAGRVPVLPRSNHSATVFGDDLNSLFFFGGTSLHSFLDDSLILTGISTDKPRWVPVYTAKVHGYFKNQFVSAIALLI